MVIYIPKHLEKIPILRDLSRMIKEYTINNSSSSFEDYHEYFAKNQVKEFITLCIDNDESLIDDKQNDRESIINYLVGLFYSIKGTPLVFEFMEKYLGIRLDDPNPDYSISELRFTITNVSVNSLQRYSDGLKEFLTALLYVGDIVININNVNLIFNDSLEISYYNNVSKYREYMIMDQFKFNN